MSSQCVNIKRIFLGKSRRACGILRMACFSHPPRFFQFILFSLPPRFFSNSRDWSFYSVGFFFGCLYDSNQSHLYLLLFNSTICFVTLVVDHSDVQRCLSTNSIFSNTNLSNHVCYMSWRFLSCTITLDLVFVAKCYFSILKS